jgi:hypothetical protein
MHTTLTCRERLNVFPLGENRILPFPCCKKQQCPIYWVCSSNPTPSGTSNQEVSLDGWTVRIKRRQESEKPTVYKIATGIQALY